MLVIKVRVLCLFLAQLGLGENGESKNNKEKKEEDNHKKGEGRNQIKNLYTKGGGV